MLVNLTPHELHILRSDGTIMTLPPSGAVARVAEVREACRIEKYPMGIVGVYEEEMALYVTRYGEIVGLPPQSETDAYVVSAMVRLAVPERLDVLSPGPLIRNEQGQPIGCDGLIANVV